MLDKEREYYSDEVKFIVGVDEAGRGPLAGPVTAAAVVFDPSFSDPRINDSKQLSEKQREELYELIIENALSYGIVSLSAEEIDKKNIYQATRQAMKEAIAKISVPYQLIITDAMKIPDSKIPVVPMVKGDAQCLNVAAASILVKVTRDRYMNELDKKYPGYGFAHHKGYGTKEHLDAIEKLGPIKGIHRYTFGPIKEYFCVQEKLF